MKALVPGEQGAVEALPRPPGEPAADAPQETVGRFLARMRWALLGLAGAFLLLFHETLFHLVRQCLKDDDFSHCLLVPLVSGAILYSRRKAIAALPARASLLGLLAVVASLLLFSFGYLRLQHSFQRLGMLGAGIGLAAYLLGPDLLKRNPFPFLYLFLAIPVPRSIYQELSLFLRKFVSAFSAGLLHQSGVPVFNSGNILYVGGEPMNVADACSGIRSLMAVISVAILFCHLFRTGLPGGILLVLSGVPVAVLVNVLRIFITGYALHAWGLDLREGVIHESMGLATFSVCLLVLYLNWIFVKWLFRLPGFPPARAEAAR